MSLPEPSLLGQWRPQPDPPFQTPEELKRTWGEEWGASDDVGPLKIVLMRRPGHEYDNQGAPEAYRPDLGIFIEPDGSQYWRGPTPPDVGLLKRQHEGLVSTLQAEGVNVLFAEQLPPTFP